MSDQSWANASAPIGQNPEHSSVQGDQNHHPKALVRVNRAERCGRKENTGGSALSQGHELPLQVTSKDRLPQWMTKVAIFLPVIALGFALESIAMQPLIDRFEPPEAG